MGTSPIGPEGPHGSSDTLSEPVTTKSGAAQTAKEGIGPNGPHSAPAAPIQPADEIGPEGPHNP